jgi:S-adenosylmethionine decarboxylase
LTYADFWGVNFDTLDDIVYLGHICKIAIERSGASIINKVEHKFTPQGCTILFLLSESHFGIHSAPEHNYIAIDAFTCSENCYPDESIDYLVDVLQPAVVKRNSVIRGVQ